MHSEIIASRRKYFHPITGSSVKTEYRDIQVLDPDEINIDEVINDLMDMLNSNDVIMEEFAKNRCKFLGWRVEKVYDPSDFYADDSGFLQCITGVNYA